MVGKGPLKYLQHFKVWSVNKDHLLEQATRGTGLAEQAAAGKGPRSCRDELQRSRVLSAGSGARVFGARPCHAQR